MSKFQVSEKGQLKNAVARRPSGERDERDEAEEPDGDAVDLDLKNERSAKWRRRVIKKLRHGGEKKQPHDKEKDECLSGSEKQVHRMRRIDLLAVPKVRVNYNELPEPFRVRPSALLHNASDRIQDLAMPKRVHSRPLTKQTDSSSASDSRNEKSTYQISDRLKSLAQPRRTVYEAHMVAAVNGEEPSAPYARFTSTARRTKESHTDRMLRLLELTKIPRHKLVQEPELLPGAVAYSALKCRASPRVEELAGPKVRWTPKQNEYAFRTKPSALRYNPSTRIEHLAIAKVRRAVVES